MNPHVRRYVLNGLEAAPLLLETLAAGLTDDEADRRPDPERFTLREVLSHLADWEAIWRERITRIVQEDNPHLPDYDEGKFAVEGDYAHRDVAEQLATFRAGREALVAFLRGLEPADWERPGLREVVGPVTIDDLATMMVGHDGYHYRQLIEFRCR